MKKIATLSLCLALSACVPVDSVRVFDDEQAAKLLQESYTTVPGKQLIVLTLPRDQWKKVDLSRGRKTSLIFVPPSEDALHWTQSIQTRAIAYPNDRSVTANQFASGQIKAQRIDCNCIQGRIIAQTEGSSTYQVQMSDCADKTRTLEIGKAFNGVDAVYAVIYRAKVSLTPGQFNSALRIISNASLANAKNPTAPS